MASSSSKGPTTRGCDFVHPVADCTAAALDLTTIAQKPKSAAQRIFFFNAGTVVGTVTVQAEVGPGMTAVPVVVPLPIAGGYTTEFPIKSITSATSTGGVVSAIVMWWVGGTLEINK